MKPDLSKVLKDVFLLKNSYNTPYLWFNIGELEYFLFSSNHFFNPNEMGNKGSFCIGGKDWGSFTDIGSWRKLDSDIIEIFTEVGVYFIKDMKLYDGIPENKLEGLLFKLEKSNS